jgi:hypothetical protein
LVNVNNAHYSDPSRNSYQVDRDFEDVDSRIVGRIRRHPSKSLPKFNDARRIMLQERTLFVGGFPKENVTLDHLIEYFEGNFDQVCQKPKHNGNILATIPPYLLVTA